MVSKHGVLGSIVVLGLLSPPALAAPPIVLGVMEGVDEVLVPGNNASFEFGVSVVPFLDTESTFALQVLGAPTGVLVVPNSVTTPTLEVSATLTVNRSADVPSTVDLELVRDPGGADEARIVPLALPSSIDDAGWLDLPLAGDEVAEEVVAEKADFGVRIGLSSSAFDLGEPVFLFELDSEPPIASTLTDACDSFEVVEELRDTSDGWRPFAATLQAKPGTVLDGGACRFTMRLKHESTLVVHSLTVQLPSDGYATDPLDNEPPEIVSPPEGTRYELDRDGTVLGLTYVVAHDDVPSADPPTLTAEDGPTATVREVSYEGVDPITGHHRFRVEVVATGTPGQSSLVFTASDGLLSASSVYEFNVEPPPPPRTDEPSAGRGCAEHDDDDITLEDGCAHAPMPSGALFVLALALLRRRA